MSFSTAAEHQIIYDKTKVLGEGAYGIVYLGTFQGTTVAVKRILLQRLKTSEREETALSRLDHPNVVKLYCVEQETEFK